MRPANQTKPPPDLFTPPENLPSPRLAPTRSPQIRHRPLLDPRTPRPQVSATDPPARAAARRRHSFLPCCSRRVRAFSLQAGTGGGARRVVGGGGEEGRHGGAAGEGPGRLRLPYQAAPHWGLGCWQVLPAAEVCGEDSYLPFTTYEEARSSVLICMHSP